MNTTIQILILVGSILTCSLSALSQERYSKISIPVSSQQEVINIAKLGISLEGASPKIKDRIDIFVNDHEVQLLRESGISFTTLIPDWYTYYAERQKQETRSVSTLMRASPLTNFHLGSMGGFFTIAELRADLDSMHARYPALISARDSIGASYENRPIWAMRISKNSTPGSEPQALYIGCHHSDEPGAMMSQIYFMWYVLEKYGTDPEVTMLLDTRELWFIPLFNVDGYSFNQTMHPSGGGMWRKNRHPDPASGEIGVDLNRNYGFKWGVDDIGSSHDPSSEVYRGSAPFSEPETQVIRDFIEAHQFTVAHTFHAYGDFVIYPWSYSSTEPPDSVVFRRLGADMTSLNRYSFGAEYAYTSNGEAADWMYGDTVNKSKIYPFTVEVGANADGFWPPISRILPLAMENVRTNLVLAHAAENYIRIDKAAVGCVFSKDSAIVSVPFINSGAGTSATTLDVSVSSPDLDITAKRSSGYAWNTLGPLNVHIKKNEPIGTKVSMVFELNYQGGKTLDTVTFRLGPAEIIYADNAEGTRSHWSSVSNSPVRWDTTTEQSHSGRLSFSESPGGNYPYNLASTFSLDTSLVLDGSAAELRFWLRGRSEDDYDCLRAEISTNGGASWIPLAGRYTSPGSGSPTEMPFGSPVLDGYKYEWVEEMMDLSAYVGDIIKIRFRFSSDEAVQFDGFYIDDVSILTYVSDQIAAPKLVSPVSVSNVPRRTTFLWRSSRYAIAYHVQVAYDTGFVALERDTVVADTTLKLSPSLGAGTSYYWHVSSLNSGVESAFSTMAQFRTGETDDVKGKGSDVPGEFALLQNFPNPFNPKTVINYQLPVNSYVALKVFDLLGREVATLVNEKKDVGRYSMQWDAGRCASGIYFYALQAGEFRETKKMILMK